MKNGTLKVKRGSGNAFRDLGHKDADIERLKAILAAAIIKVLDRDKLTVRAAHAQTRVAAADFSRIRNADLARFTIDRLIAILNRLGWRVDVKVRVQPTMLTGPAEDRALHEFVSAAARRILERTEWPD